MGRGLAVIGFPGVSTFEDRHGRPRFRYRRKGVAVYLPGAPGSPEFAAAYAAAVTGEPKPAQGSRAAPGSISALVTAYLASAEFRTLSVSTQRTYTGIVERLRTDYGDLQLRGLRPEHVRAMRDKRASTPSAANNSVRLLRLLMAFAVDRGLRADNPAASIKALAIRTSGFHTWTEEEIAAFMVRWPLGTRERLALDLLLYTAQRSGDVRLMGRQHVRGGMLHVRQRKTRAELVIPVRPALQASLDATPSDHLTFLTTQFGQPFSEKGFGNWFSAAATAAGLPHCSAHGLRKAASRRIAEKGGSALQIAAVTGHATLKEVQRYTKAADQQRLAVAALEGIGETKREQDLANPAERLAKQRRK